MSLYDDLFSTPSLTKDNESSTTASEPRSTSSANLPPPNSTADNKKDKSATNTGAKSAASVGIGIASKKPVIPASWTSAARFVPPVRKNVAKKAHKSVSSTTAIPVGGVVVKVDSVSSSGPKPSGRDNLAVESSKDREQENPHNPGSLLRSSLKKDDKIKTKGSTDDYDPLKPNDYEECKRRLLIEKQEKLLALQHARNRDDMDVDLLENERDRDSGTGSRDQDIHRRESESEESSSDDGDVDGVAMDVSVFEKKVDEV